MLRVCTERRGSTVIVSVGGEVDASNRDTWKWVLSKTAATVMAPGALVVDVRHADFLGCCAFAVLADQARWCRRRAVSLCLISHQPIVAKTVAACGLRPLLPILPTVETALARGADGQADR